ncbi:hypothetical protein [Pseudalkalibacillus sp. NRS-1564]|uniref:hypothetical protein n=1 Tax=Pseudalkalibacillus sp. NRS-1564 TaxID=3233900 RepID=UPI003D2E2960
MDQDITKYLEEISKGINNMGDSSQIVPRLDSLTENIYSSLQTTNVILGIIAVILLLNLVLKFMEVRNKK